MMQKTGSWVDDSLCLIYDRQQLMTCAEAHTCNWGRWLCISTLHPPPSSFPSATATARHRTDDMRPTSVRCLIVTVRVTMLRTVWFMARHIRQTFIVSHPSDASNTQPPIVVRRRATVPQLHLRWDDGLTPEVLVWAKLLIADWLLQKVNDLMSPCLQQKLWIISCPTGRNVRLTSKHYL